MCALLITASLDVPFQLLTHLQQMSRWTSLDPPPVFACLHSLAARALPILKRSCLQNGLRAQQGSPLYKGLSSARKWAESMMMIFLVVCCMRAVPRILQFV